MKLSCSGCRVLRKGCSENCTIRPCLQWIQTIESQANATVFLAKYYGRAGLQNLLNAGPDHLRPEIFKSLLYEACGRIVNPIYGSTGLLWSGNWNLCQAAVEAVLSGAPIVQVSSESAVATMSPPLMDGNIRHVLKEEASEASLDLHKVKNHMKFKGVAASGSKLHAKAEPSMDEVAAQVIWSWTNKKDTVFGSASHESLLSHEAEKGHSGWESSSAETVEASLVMEEQGRARGGNLELELTLGLEPVMKEDTIIDEDEMMMDGVE